MSQRKVVVLSSSAIEVFLILIPGTTYVSVGEALSSLFLFKESCVDFLENNKVGRSMVHPQQSKLHKPLLPAPANVFHPPPRFFHCFQYRCWATCSFIHSRHSCN
ncbi:hypothetical protein BDR07DRAFT_926867 [Suillus spraguei]|nr:hypothetical protein BDR07DRAFT_926867 [Suillus spraguei]